MNSVCVFVFLSFYVESAVSACIMINYHTVDLRGSNTDGLFTTAVSKSFLIPLEKNSIAANSG